jgi:hypothetical protein
VIEKFRKDIGIVMDPMGVPTVDGVGIITDVVGYNVISCIYLVILINDNCFGCYLILLPHNRFGQTVYQIMELGNVGLL